METCIFCNIKKTLKESTREVVYKDKVVTVFESKAHDARLHLLVIPNKHIDGVESLNYTHTKLLNYMVNVAKSVLGNNNKKYIMGFHKLPFRSVNHLHMHVLVPPFRSWLTGWKYSENTPFFASVENLMQHIKK
jgi:diadenosine tetraphosphate (Ap4A) HIT family hydrolase